MSYEIIPNRFAPKRLDRSSVSNSHSICFNRCNFCCPFCDFRERPLYCYKNFSDKEFENLVIDLIQKGNNFKFTGGEPTLNPKLISHLKIVRKYGGYIYLDSNGHNPKLLDSIMSENLINVLGISLKGLDAQEAQKISCVKKKLCWDNVIETLKSASTHKNIRTIVTAVFTQENFLNRIERFASFLEQFPSVYMKINNLQLNHTAISNNLHKVPPISLENQVQTFISKNVKWKGRIILINDENAVEDYSKIIFF